MKYIWNVHKVLIAGHSGSGKTELALFLMRNAKRFLIVDANLEISLSLKLPYTRNLHDWNFDTPVFWPQDYTVRMLDSIIIRARHFRNYALFIDDIDSYSGGMYYSGQQLQNAMINLRHQNIGLILTMKRIVGIDYKIPQNSNFVYLFNVSPLDYSALKTWNGTLSYPGNLTDLCRMEAHTFAAFEPADTNSMFAADPKHFIGFKKLHPKQTLLGAGGGGGGGEQEKANVTSKKT